MASLLRPGVLILLLVFSAPVVAQELVGQAPVESQTGTAYGLAWQPQSALLAVASGGEITLLDGDFNLITTAIPGEGALSVGWNPDGTQLAQVSGFRGGFVYLWDWNASNATLTQAGTLDTSASAWEPEARSDNPYLVAWKPDGTQLAVLVDDQQTKIQLWDVATQAPAAFLDLPYEVPARTLLWDGDHLIGAGLVDGEAVLFSVDTTSGETTDLLTLLVNPQNFAFTLSPDMTQVVVIDASGSAQIIDLATDETTLTFETVADPVALAWSGNRLFVLGYEDGLQAWDLPDAVESRG